MFGHRSTLLASLGVSSTPLDPSMLIVLVAGETHIIRENLILPSLGWPHFVDIFETAVVHLFKENQVVVVNDVFNNINNKNL